MKHNVIFIIAVLLSWAGLLRAADDGRTDCVTALPVQVVPGGQAVLQLWLQGDDGYEADGRTHGAEIEDGAEVRALTGGRVAC